ncbi:MAG: ester cyclase [Hyphomicrobiales bacterium]
MTFQSAQDHLDQSNETLAIIHRMEEALSANENDMSLYFHDDFRWMGNYGCGTKEGVKAFRENWQLPLRSAFTDRIYKTEKFLADGEWASCFGHIEGTHSGTFMGVAATQKRIKIPYMDFWKVKDGKIADNWVSVDYPLVMAQLGVDVFAGEGWEAFDNGTRVPPRPAEQGASS